MPIARYWVVKTGGNEVTEEMVSVWKEHFLGYAMENGCLRGALVSDAERIVAGTIWPDMETMNAVIEGEHYSKILEPPIEVPYLARPRAQPQPDISIEMSGCENTVHREKYVYWQVV